MRGLYAIADVATLQARGLPLLAFAEAILSVRPVALQLRAKAARDDEVLGLLRALSPACRRASVPLFANDRPDLARLAGCEGVHVGQKDMTVEEARRVAPGLAVGVSTHTPEQLERALAARPDYVAFGPVFDTRTKLDPDPAVGIKGLRAAYARSSTAGVALVAIGGISCERAGSLVGAADAMVLISDLVPDRAWAALRGACEGAPASFAGGDVLDEVVRRARFAHELLSPPTMRSGLRP